MGAALAKFRGCDYMPLKLKQVLVDYGVTHSALAEGVLQSTGRPMSKAAISLLINWGYWPKNTTQTNVRTQVEAFLARPAFAPEAEETARRVLADVRAAGDKAVQKYTKEFNGIQLAPGRFAVSKEERIAASEQVDLMFKRGAADVFARIVRFGKAGMRKDWSMATPKGGVLGEKFTPLTRVGAYIPGGAAPLASTALMSVCGTCS